LKDMCGSSLPWDVCVGDRPLCRLQLCMSDARVLYAHFPWSTHRTHTALYVLTHPQVGYCIRRRNR
jgi:hypothetical protein